MSKRHSDALMIQEGAVNPSGMAHSLVSACKECLNEGVSQRDDPAVKLIVHQLAYICGITTGAEEMARAPLYAECGERCREIVNDCVQAPAQTIEQIADRNGGLQ